jgi:hypothetical protein
MGLCNPLKGGMLLLKPDSSIDGIRFGWYCSATAFYSKGEKGMKINVGRALLFLALGVAIVLGGICLPTPRVVQAPQPSPVFVSIAPVLPPEKVKPLKAQKPERCKKVMSPSVAVGGPWDHSSVLQGVDLHGSLVDRATSCS